MNVPQLRFDGFDGEWVSKKIKNIATVTSGLTPLRSDLSFFTNGTIPWVKTMDLNNSIIKATHEYITEKALKETSLRLLPTNTLLIAMYGGFNQIGRTGLIDFSGTTNQAISALTPIENSFNPFFLQSYLNFNVGKWKRLAASSRKDPNITKADIENFFVKLPLIEEQRKIASFFRLIEQKLEQQQEKIELLEQFKKGMMQKVFSQELRFKDEDGGEFPEWEEKRLKEVGIFKSGVGFSEKYQGEKDLKYPFIKVSDMNLEQNEKKIVVSNNTVSENMLKEMKVTPINGPAILFAKVGAAIFLERKRLIDMPFLIDNNMMSFIPNVNLHIKFAYHLLNSLRLSAFAQVGALPSYNGSDLATIKISLPSKEEQLEIIKYLDKLDLKLEKEKEKLMVLEEQKKGFMQGMFV